MNAHGNKNKFNCPLTCRNISPVHWNSDTAQCDPSDEIIKHVHTCLEGFSPAELTSGQFTDTFQLYVWRKHWERRSCSFLPDVCVHLIWGRCHTLITSESKSEKTSQSRQNQSNQWHKPSQSEEFIFPCLSPWTALRDNLINVDALSMFGLVCIFLSLNPSFFLVCFPGCCFNLSDLMFIIDLCSPSLCDVELCVDLIQNGWVSCFSDPLKHTLELQFRLQFTTVQLIIWWQKQNIQKWNLEIMLTIYLFNYFFPLH